MSSNRHSAITFLEMTASGKVKEAFERFVSPDFHHHNVYFAGDRQSLMAAMEDNAAQNPVKKLKVKLLLEDKDMVATYSMVQMPPKEIAVTHIFKFKDGKIMELWDIGQVIPDDSPNEFGPA